MIDNREKLIEILETKFNEGLTIIENSTIDDKDYGTKVLNMLNTKKSAQQLRAEIDFDAAQLLIKNKELEAKEVE